MADTRPTDTPPAPTPAPQDSGGIYKTLVSILIAIVAVIGAWVTWRATVLASDANNANSGGLASVLSAEQARTLNVTTLYQHYAAYTAYTRYRVLGERIDDDLNNLYYLSDAGSFDAHPELETYADSLDRQRDETFDMASAGQYFFPTRYLEQDGSYNKARELGESDALSARDNAQNANQSFALADRLRDRSNQLVGVVIVLTLSLLLYTLAAALDNPLQYVMGALGLVVMLGGVLAALIIGV